MTPEELRTIDSEEDPEESALKAGPVGSYEWHKAVFFWGGDPTEEEEDAFRSGWLRAKSHARKKEEAMNREKLEEMSEEDLNEQVHDLKSEEAAEINNQGKDAQIAYVLGD